MAPTYVDGVQYSTKPVLKGICVTSFDAKNDDNFWDSFLCDKPYEALVLSKWFKWSVNIIFNKTENLTRLHWIKWFTAILERNAYKAKLPY